MNRLVDMGAYRKHYAPEHYRYQTGRLLPDGTPEEADGVRRAKPMGSFPRSLLTPLGLRVLDGLKPFTGRLNYQGRRCARVADYRGASDAGMYLKWKCYDDAERAVLLGPAADWVIDLLGPECVKVSHPEARSFDTVAARTVGRDAATRPRPAVRYVKYDLR